MKREEQIKYHAGKYEYNLWEENKPKGKLDPDWDDVRNAYINGAKWADEHPTKGLVDTEKVCKWLEENIEKYVYINTDWNIPGIDYDFLKNLRKMMEE